MESMIKFGGYDWRVLEKKDGSMLVMADKVLELRAFYPRGSEHGSFVKIKWSDSEARKYLNGDFFSRFNAEEKARIIESTVKAEQNPWYGSISAGDDTQDYVFLLSIGEVVKYLGDGKDVAKKAGKSKGVMNDDSNAKRQAALSDGNPVSWWLRSAGSGDNFAALVNDKGGLAIGGFNVTEAFGLRPAMWIKE